MASGAEENATTPRITFPPQSIEAEWYGANDEARQLLRLILPDEEWTQLEKKGVIEFAGTRGIYTISPNSQTEIRDLRTGRRLGRACLQLSIVAPAYDRMIAEYLLLKNAEDFYWKTANVFEREEFNIPVVVLTLLAIAFFIYVLLEIAAAG